MTNKRGRNAVKSGYTSLKYGEKSLFLNEYAHTILRAKKMISPKKSIP